MSLEKTCHLDFRPVPTQTALYNHRRWLGPRDLEGRQWLYYLCSDYKGVGQLQGYYAADLCLCFVHMQKAGFFMTRLNPE